MKVSFRDLGQMDYKACWDLQQTLFDSLTARKRPAADTVRNATGTEASTADAARAALDEAGSGEPVRAEVVRMFFDTRVYDGFTMPAGWYDALRVVIGEGKGHNWWCVLYPSLCFADALEPSMTEEGEEKLQQVLDEDAYDLLLHPQKLKIRFRLEFFLRNR